MTRKPVKYDDLVREVRRYRPVHLLKRLASLTSQQVHREGPLVKHGDLMMPWAASLVAREALAASGPRHPSRRATQAKATNADLARLNDMVIALEDPILEGPSSSLGDWRVRVAFQQFPYQQPAFHATARLRPMFKRTFPHPRYQVLNDTLIEGLIGSDIDTFVDTAPFFLASVQVNGRFDPAWLSGPQFKPVLEKIPAQQLLRVLEQVWARGIKDQRQAAKVGRSKQSSLRQYDYNPLLAAPFVGLDDGTYIAPQTWFAATRVGPSAIYYAGIEAGMAKTLLTDLGHLNEDYCVDQARQLIGRAEVDGDIPYDKDGDNGQLICSW